ncbi:uncharacterized protein SPSK_01471 [Sporothrix schenckii 1099-18]|uniref:Uncharacterized protein n=1 Tax=Sporothrix schenckii 1099-18 TaxID=1397361 RepID=A0A0F2MDG3_SPOSC|nr:uncharacterized protein SPSK_01471 [Sporothrix schenckii 1099-18]KJR87124.1 hypothetical protein SPSK_01471 [Sporothrix schenckii 1099-18]
MHGLLQAGLLLAPALARGVGATASPQHDKPSAFVTLDVPDAGLENSTPFLTFRLDVFESLTPCGTANVTINGEALPEDGKLSLPLVPDFQALDTAEADTNADETSNKDTPSAVISWGSDCVSWGGRDREQVMNLRIVSVNGVAVNDDAAKAPTTVRFRQIAPARIVLIQNAASAFHFNDEHFKPPTTLTASADTAVDTDDSDNTSDNDADAADLIAWENSLIMMHRSVALLHHSIDARERYIVDRFGPSASPLIDAHKYGAGKRGGPCSGVTSVIGSVLHKVAGTAKSLYGELIANTFGEDTPRGQPGWAPPHGHHHGAPQGPRHGHPKGQPFMFRPYCVPEHGRAGPPPPPPPPPSFLFHCSSVFAPLTAPDDELTTPSPPPPPSKGFRPKHPHGPPPPVSQPSNDEGHHHGGPGPEGPSWVGMAGGGRFDKRPVNKGGEFRGRKMHGYGPDGPQPRVAWKHGHHGYGSHLFRHAPVAKMVAFFSLVLILLFVFGRRCRNRRVKERLLRRANRPRGFRRFTTRFQRSTEGSQERHERQQDRHERRQARRERRRERRREHKASVRSFFRNIRRFVFGGHNGDEKLGEPNTRPSDRTNLRTPADGHIVTSTPPSRQHSPAPSLEDEIAEFRAAADVVGQMIAAEEGRAAIAQTAESRRQQQDDDLERAMHSVSPPASRNAIRPAPVSASAPAAARAAPPPAPIAPYRQPPPPPPPPPSVVNTSNVVAGYGRRDAAGIDSDFDDTESLPPAYSPDDDAYVNFVEASLVADGFQYHPGANH